MRPRGEGGRKHVLSAHPPPPPSPPPQRCSLGNSWSGNLSKHSWPCPVRDRLRGNSRPEPAETPGAPHLLWFRHREAERGLTSARHPGRRGPARTPRSLRADLVLLFGLQRPRTRSALRFLPPGPPRGAEREALETGQEAPCQRGPQGLGRLSAFPTPGSQLARSPANPGRSVRERHPPQHRSRPSASRREAATHLCPPRVATRRPAARSPGRSEAHTASRGRAR